VLQVQREPFVPEGRRHVLHRVAVVPPGVVHQHLDRAVRTDDLSQQRLVGLDVAHVAGGVDRCGQTGGTQFVGQRLPAVGPRAAEGHARALLREGPDQFRADAGAAAGDEDEPVLQRRIAGVAWGVGHAGASGLTSPGAGLR
jgi:hypothetical protein